MKIACFGDSNTWGYDPRGYFGGRYDRPWPELLADRLHCTVVNLGENGREIPAKAAAFPADADLLIIMLGTNDLLQGQSPDLICRKMERFLQAWNPEKLLIIAPPPMKPGAWVNGPEMIEASESLTRYYRMLANWMGIRFADAGKWDVSLSYDGVHFTEKGHRAFADGLGKELAIL